MNLPTLLSHVRRSRRAERWHDHDAKSSPSDLALRPFLHVHGLHR